MASVNVTINGKTYRMACEEGQEPHLVSLAERLDSYVTQLKGSFGEIGDQRLTVMAGVMVTDELVELEKKVGTLEKQLADIKASADNKVSEMTSAEKETSERISQLADRISDLAEKLDGKPAAKK